jgi:hypothetical protein
MSVDFTVINRLSVAIESHRNRLLSCEDPDELEEIYRQIATMEIEMMRERRKELTGLQQEKETLLTQMTALESRLDEVNRRINQRVNKYKEMVTNKMSAFEGIVSRKRSELEVDGPEME